MNRFYASIIAFLVPIAVLASMVIDREMDLRRGKILILPISGYDPRDLLSGQYIRFRVEGEFSERGCQTAETASADPTEIPKPKKSKRESCVCFQDREPSAYETISIPDCNPESLKDSGCWTYVRGECNGDYFDFPYHKYFVPEASAKEFEDRLRTPGAKIQLRMDESGNGIIEKILWPEVSSQ
ncbi:GDYXXLXY protein [Leptospira wolffii]|uniref:GDYXXLXY protein n=1 Tax=Leptospira wolffii TaxID=409998 RepID=A0A2M9Z8R0_9LEPT|nr:GDYXXLXY domain-containing protein [Leptospira wolffii]EPG66556.1 GDYXXLXY protein [Leptospira wolffii serovar Khorat str. Khorat-H2]PJZ64806.1 GDYXXLXY protein [Leptospira wolffii]TGK56896.1 GDYXXLXY protein [Leptospira wolffii]TGK71522.1 GDYXXLXY protein [Leptospira wolffii]TGK75622.1 GDYXXLXY protein [Leptospira wolffii]